MIPSIKKVEYISGYKLKLFFKNGRVKIFDMEARLMTAKEMFLPLRDIEFFKKVRCEDGTIVWPNGVDLCPESLYKIAKDLRPQKKRIRKKALQTIKLKSRKKLKA